ncbi:MAG: tRNA 2-thiouridine(34) synthase MnmA [Oscillospiraceae bacterium]|jgi:tRNA-specific 2-thiouridylase|nr:tRNA 2-thiouridine(34) synthase MnmA [Oscillospiraceae bacterium]
MKKKVLLGMSGGVDSSVAALLLLDMGYNVTGVTMKLKSEFDCENGGCCSLDDIDDARRVCYKLNIEHIVVNFSREFEELVVEDFINEYKEGKTPNPCIKCNQKIKFDKLLQRAKSLGFDYISTGHYASIEFNKNLKRFVLKKSKSNKDQSYVLYGMTQDQLKQTLMPIGSWQKSEIREIAKKKGLLIADKPDSQDICFVKDNYKNFIKKNTTKTIKGNFIDEKGNILGTHNGIVNYTVGQRRSLNISLGKRMFVININAKKNEITLGEYQEQFKKNLIVKKLNFINFDKLQHPMKLKTKIRYQRNENNAVISPLKNGRVLVEFFEHQKSPAPGQAAVFYDGDFVVGGGIITKAF